MKTYKIGCPQINLVAEKDPTYKAVKITSSKDAADFCRNFFQSDIDIYESMFMVLLNRANNTIGLVKISQGGISGTVCDPKIIMKYVCETMASSIVMCHNHPSGNLNPSGPDRELTQKIKMALSYVDSKILDHIILTSESYYSFGDNGLL